jgi:hypothetical protein
MTGYVLEFQVSVLEFQVVFTQAPVQRPAAVLDYSVGGEDDSTASREFPVDVLCAIRVHNPTTDVEEDLVFIQGYELVLDGGDRHPFVKTAEFVYLGDSYELKPPTDLKRPALLVPNMSQGKDKRFKFSQPTVTSEGARAVTRPTFFWVPYLQ